MFLNENIVNLAQKALLDERHFILDVVISAKSGPKKITVVLDGDQGITIEDCAHTSRRLSALLEESGAMEDDNFTLEVTTPGLDSPLKSKRQYVKNVGRGLKVQLKDKSIENGKLVEVSNDAIALEQEIKEGKKKELRKTELPFSEIERAVVQISFK